MKTTVLLAALSALLIACGPGNSPAAPDGRGIHVPTPAEAPALTGDDDKLVPLGEACAQGDHSACNRLAGSLIEEGRTADAQALFTSTCEAGWAGACYTLGTSLLQGDGLPADARAAAPLLERGCALGLAASCYAHGSAVIAGQFQGDRQQATALVTQACTQGHDPACRSLMHLRADR